MPITTLTSRAFNQDASGAKQAARRGPVFISNRGRADHVLLSIEQYQKHDEGGPIEVIYSSKRPAISGFPGRMATFQKSIAAPEASSAGFTRS